MKQGIGNGNRITDNGLGITDNDWTDVAPFDPVWPCLYNFAQFGQIWQKLAPFDPFCPVWPC